MKRSILIPGLLLAMVLVLLLGRPPKPSQPAGVIEQGVHNNSGTGNVQTQNNFFTSADTNIWSPGKGPEDGVMVPDPIHSGSPDLELIGTPIYESYCKTEIEILAATKVPELAVMKRLAVAQGVNQNYLYTFLRVAYVAVSEEKAKEAYTQEKIQELNERTTETLNRTDLSEEDKRKGIDLDQKMEFGWIESVEAMHQAEFEKYRAQLVSLSGIEDKEFYRELLALRPREDASPLRTNYVFVPYAD